MAIQTPITEHLATRANSIDFSTLGMLLPNPDPILKAQGKDISTYRDMRMDSHIGGCIRRRKAAVLALDWGLDKGKTSSRAAKAVQEMLDGLKLDRIISQMQECTLYGYQPMEVLWQPKKGLWVPDDVLAKPPEWFCFDANNAFRFKTKANPMTGELTPARKYLIPRQDPTYKNPYGFPDLAMCYWPLLFMKNSLKFWLAFAEKFGSAFSVGKLPRNATDAERQALLDSLQALIQNGVATIPDDGSVELVEMAGKGASADLYEKLVMHCRSNIAIALLGQNQTTEASANKASATAGLRVTDDLRDGDAKIISDSINELIAWFCDYNFGDVQPPVFSMWDQEAQDKLQADRDKSNNDAGAKFTNAYWMRAYGYQEGDLLPQGSKGVLASPATASFAEASVPIDAVDSIVTDAMQGWEPVLAPMVDPVQAALDESVTKGETAAQFLARLPEVLEKMDPDALARALTQAAFAARLGAHAGLTDV